MWKSRKLNFTEFVEKWITKFLCGKLIFYRISQNLWKTEFLCGKLIFTEFFEKREKKNGKLNAKESVKTEFHKFF